jgi:hypothetical protein
MKYKSIGLYELITGVFGVLLLIFNIGKAFNDTSILFTFVLGILLYAGVAYAGYSLLNNFKNGVKLSILAQALQMMSFIAGGIQYMFTASAFISLVYQQDLNLKSQLAPIAYNISKVSEYIPFEITFYVVPIVLAVLLIIKD